MNGFLPSAVLLGAVAVIALLLGLRRGWAPTHPPGGVAVVVLAVISQAVHFTEELATGFHERLPALFGLDAMSLRVFVIFNVGWLVIWGVSAWGLAARHRAALFPLWFLGIASALNGVAHPALAVYVGGYFPGLVTSPIVGIVGVLLLRRLLVATDEATA